MCDGRWCESVMERLARRWRCLLVWVGLQVLLWRCERASFPFLVFLRCVSSPPTGVIGSWVSVIMPCVLNHSCSVYSVEGLLAYIRKTLMYNFTSILRSTLYEK